MNKYLISILYTLLIFILTIAVFDYFLYFKEYIKCKDAPFFKALRYYNVIRPDFSMKNIDFNILRKPCGLQYKKSPILIYGCSFAFGNGDTDHLGYYLSKLTKRPVYNYSIGAKGLQHSLYLLEHQKPVKPQPECIIYVYIQDQIRRMYLDAWILDYFSFYGHYLQNEKLIEKKEKFKIIKYLKNTCIYYYLKNHYFWNHIPDKERYQLFFAYIQAMKKEIDKKYPKTKFIFIIYDIKNYNYLYLSKERVQQIKNLGIEVIILDDIFDNKLYTKEYQRSETDPHPNTKAWQMIAPEIVKLEKL
ncbi:hypothetical protein IJG14_08340 [bacterium]|nr:hypothetical protein [bacterium]